MNNLPASEILGHEFVKNIGIKTFEYPKKDHNDRNLHHTFNCPCPHRKPIMSYSDQLTQMVDKHNVSAINYEDVDDQ